MPAHAWPSGRKEGRVTQPNAGIELLLAQDLVRRHPLEAAKHLTGVQPKEAAQILAGVEPTARAAAARHLAPSAVLDIAEQADPAAAAAVLRSLDPPRAGALLRALAEPRREQLLAILSPIEVRELRRLMRYPADTAGGFMDPRFAMFDPDTSAEEALSRLRRASQARTLLHLIIVDADGALCGTVPLYVAALAEPATRLGALIHGPPVSVSPFAVRTEVVEAMERHCLTSMPVIDQNRRPLGALRLNELMGEVGKEFSADLVSMTGASKEETALSSASFAVRKRLPWLQINLVTAFIAAAVVGLFEETIAQFTALAVLLPVVAGQSGNTGSQALAVVVRGLALREISLRQWPQAAAKELVAGILNGVGVGAVTCAGVYLWSGSVGLVLVIGIAMVLSMALAGIAGAVIPVLLAALGQDPAQSSSILLTTVTDVCGFLSFLGLATVFADMI